MSYRTVQTWTGSLDVSELLQRTINLMQSLVVAFAYDAANGSGFPRSEIEIAYDHESWRGLLEVWRRLPPADTPIGSLTLAVERTRATAFIEDALRAFGFEFRSGTTEEGVGFFRVTDGDLLDRRMNIGFDWLEANEPESEGTD